MDSFAVRYIQNNVVYPPFVNEKVPPDLKMIVMIPCLNEPEIIGTIESLWECIPVKSRCEVIVTVNHSASALPEVKKFNEETFHKLLHWKKGNDRYHLTLHPIFAPDINPKFAGAGMARKIGMDEAVRRFQAINKPDGVIISTDSDCLFSADYLQKIEAAFSSKSTFAATINFRHRLGETYDLKHEQGIRLYEDYLHYYKRALQFTGFPEAVYTIGSAFAVRAEAYVKQGGMNRRQAGEDFYFMNKLTKLGKITEIADAYVFPSGRISDRVPFGTGAAMTKWMNESSDLALTYRFDAFLDLKAFFGMVDSMFRVHSAILKTLTDTIPESIVNYLNFIDFEAKMEEINRNCSTPENFRKRFYQYFDAFIILKYLNFAHIDFYSRQNLYDAIDHLRKYTGEWI